MCVLMIDEESLPVSQVSQTAKGGDLQSGA
jgi:hypothetical protein